MMNTLAPIVLFVYNRPDHTRQTLEALSKNDLADQSVLYIYADGAKEGAAEEVLSAISATRELITQRNWCKEVHVIESVKNRGLAASIVLGVTEIVNKHGKIIVLEDDIVTSTGFLKYMNDCLSLYENEEKVMHVSGFMYDINPSYVDGFCFLKMLSCWGWGTWSNAWKYYNDDLDFFIKALDTPQKIADFNVGGSASFYTQLYDNYMSKLKTWAVRWYASWYTQGGLSIFPKTSLVLNVGHDGSGVNCGPPQSFYETNIIAREITVTKADEIVEDLDYKEKLSQFFVKEKNFFSMSNTQAPMRISLVERVKHNLNKFISRITKSALFRYDLYYGASSILKRQKQDFYGSVGGSNTIIHPPYLIHGSSIGNFTFIHENSIIRNTVIGKFCSVGANFVCGSGSFSFDGISTAPMFYSTSKHNGVTLSEQNKIIEQKPIKIGNDVFIGINVTILDGITIGDGAVISSGTVVSKDVPPYTIVEGVPMNFIKKRFSDDQIESLLRIKWWDFSWEQLKDVESMFFDMDVFIKKYDIV